MYFVIMDDVDSTVKHYSHYDVVSLGEFMTLLEEVGTCNSVAFTTLDAAADFSYAGLRK